MSDKLIILASCEGVTPLKDKGWSVRFHTQEPSKSQIDDLLNAHTGFGILTFHSGKESLSDEEIQELDEIDVDVYDKPKTQSERIRNVLYAWFKQTELKGHESEELKRELFKSFYKTKTEQFISHIKAKLEP